MIGVTLRTFLPGEFIQIKSALEHAVRVLPKAERIPSVKACLADRILTLSTSGETDPIRLSKIAVADVRERCVGCKGCEGMSASIEANSLSFQHHFGGELHGESSGFAQAQKLRVG